jgi:hypothetical protein
VNGHMLPCLAPTPGQFHPFRVLRDWRSCPFLKQTELLERQQPKRHPAFPTSPASIKCPRVTRRSYRARQTRPRSRKMRRRRQLKTAYISQPLLPYYFFSCYCLMWYGLPCSRTPSYRLPGVRLLCDCKIGAPKLPRPPSAA